METIEIIPINDSFPDELLFSVKSSVDPWYADLVNFLAGYVKPFGLSSHQRKKFYANVKHYYWNESFLYKRCGDGMIKRGVLDHDKESILTFCHTLECGGHFSVGRTVTKMLQS